VALRFFKLCSFDGLVIGGGCVLLFLRVVILYMCILKKKIRISVHLSILFVVPL